MNKKESISAIAATLLKNFDRDTVKAAAEFLHEIEVRRRMYKADDAELSPQRKRLEHQIIAAFDGVTCYREVRVLLGGEAEDEYWTADVQALLSPLEERQNWQNIPDDLLYACSCALTYAGPHAYRFLVPRYLIGALHGVVDVCIGEKPNSKFVGLMRSSCAFLNKAQQACLSNYLNLEVVEADRYQRNDFLPWELDEYAASFAATHTYAEYGKLLIERYLEHQLV
ncbi:MAG: hypothetical protein IJ993_04225 [Akkermansia sp.]|nr:hypothetical protein [Akkermansia sp.]